MNSSKLVVEYHHAADTDQLRAKTSSQRKTKKSDQSSAKTPQSPKSVQVSDHPEFPLGASEIVEAIQKLQQALLIMGESFDFQLPIKADRLRAEMHTSAVDTTDGAHQKILPSDVEAYPALKKLLEYTPQRKNRAIIVAGGTDGLLKWQSTHRERFIRTVSEVLKRKNIPLRSATEVGLAFVMSAIGEEQALMDIDHGDAVNHAREISNVLAQK